MTELVIADIQDKGFKLKLNSIDEYITEGKKIVKSLHCHQALMAYYALSVCQIKNGGNGSQNCYTLRQYSRDVGLNEKSLRQWTLVYRRVIQHLGIPLDLITKNDWKNANKVTRLQEIAHSAVNRANGTMKRKEASLSMEVKRTPESVRKMFNDVSTGADGFYSEAWEWNRRFLSVKNSIKKRQLSLADEKCLIEIMNYCDEISDYINTHLTNKRKSK